MHRTGAHDSQLNGNEPIDVVDQVRLIPFIELLTHITGIGSACKNDTKHQSSKNCAFFGNAWLLTTSLERRILFVECLSLLYKVTCR